MPLEALARFIGRLKAAMAERGIPFLALPAAAVLLVIAVVAVFFFLQPQGTSAFRMTVMSGSEAVAGATVEVYDEQGNIVDAGVTDPSGAVSFASLPASILRFRVVKAGVGSMERKVDLRQASSVRVELGQEQPAANVTAPKLPSPEVKKAQFGKFDPDNPPKGKLAVIVRSSPGKAVDANVTLFNSDSGAQIANAETRKGTAVFEELDSGTKVFVTVIAPGYLPFPQEKERKDIVISPGSNSVQAVLTDENANTSVSSSIQVTDADGKPIAGAKVLVLSVENAVLKQGESAADGSFKAVLAPGLFYYAVAKKDGYLAGRASLYSDSPAAIKLVKATANNSATLSVSVVDEDGAPVSGASVLLTLDNGEFLSAAKTTASSGGTEFRELALNSAVIAVATKGNKVGRERVELANRSVAANVTLSLRFGFVNAVASDAVTGAAIRSAGLSFAAFYRGMNVSQCGGSNCSLFVKANAPITIQASHPDYFPANSTAFVQTDGRVSVSVSLIPKSTADNSLAAVESIFDANYPSDRADGAAIRSFRLKKGHDYSVQIHFVSSGIGILEDGGLLVRAGAGAFIKSVDLAAGFRGSESVDCAPIDTMLRDDRGYSWIDLRTKGAVSRTYSVGFRVDPAAGSSVRLSYSTYVVKRGQWFRNPGDPELGLNETAKWCQADAKETLSFSTADPDRTCTPLGCIEVSLQQGSRACSFSGGSGSCEGFKATANPAYGDLIINYVVRPLVVPRSDNTLVLNFDRDYFSNPQLKIPGRTVGSVETHEDFAASVDHVIQRADFPYNPEIRGSATLTPIAGGDTFVNFSLVNAGKILVEHSVPVSIESFAKAASYRTYTGMEVPLTAVSTTAGIQSGTFCNTTDPSQCWSISVSFAQVKDGSRKTGFSGFSVSKSESFSCEDGLNISYSLTDSMNPVGGRLSLSGYGSDIAPLITGPAAFLDASGKFERPVDASQIAGRAVSGWVCAKVNKQGGTIRLTFNYKNSQFETFVISEIPPLPDKYLLKYKYVDGQSDYFKLYEGTETGAVKQAISLNSYPIFPADAVYLVLDMSESQCLTPIPAWNAPADPCFSMSESVAFDPLTKKKVALLKYNALASGCGDAANPNQLAGRSGASGVNLSFSLPACPVAGSVPTKIVPVTVTANNSIPAIFLAKAEDLGFANANWGSGLQPGGNLTKLWVLVDSRQVYGGYGGFMGLKLQYDISGAPAYSPALDFTAPGVKVFAADENNTIILQGTADITARVNKSAFAAGVSIIGSLEDVTAGGMPRVFGRRSSGSMAFPFSAFTTAKAKFAWARPGDMQLAGESTGCGAFGTPTAPVGLFEYSFETQGYDSDAAALRAATTADALEISQGKYYTGSTEQCPTENLCGTFYTACAKCILPGGVEIQSDYQLEDAVPRKSRYLLADHSACSSDNKANCVVPAALPSLPVFHYPTCNAIIFSASGSERHEKSTECDHLGQWETFSIYNLILKEAATTKSICAGDMESCKYTGSGYWGTGTGVSVYELFANPGTIYDSGLKIQYSVKMFNSCSDDFVGMGGDLEVYYPNSECIYSANASYENSSVCSFDYQAFSNTSDSTWTCSNTAYQCSKLCGASGQTCCASNACNSPLRCLIGGVCGSASSCGGFNQDCCLDSPRCNLALRCLAVTGKCGSSG